MQRVIVLLGLAVCAQAHMSIWVPSMWGREPNNPNANWAVQPLENLDFNDWWMHGPKSVNDPPEIGNITMLPAGGTIDFEILGNKAQSSMGVSGHIWTDPKRPGVSPRAIPDPWSNDGNGFANLHAPARNDVAGCALGIAYKSKIGDVKPEDFVIMSVVHDCIARQLQVFDIPALPACPNGQCVCSWFWIHNSIGGTDQMYMTPFQCNVTNPSKRVIGRPSVPTRCDGKPPCYLYPNWGNTTTTCAKTFNPMYWANNNGNNMFMPTNWQCAPTYSEAYGFPDGAQNQIFVDGLQGPQGTLGDTLVSNKDLNVISSSPRTGLSSPSFDTSLMVTEDGNVVFSVIRTGKVIWSTNTAGVNGVAPYRLTMQNDGQLVLQDSTNAVFWSSNTKNIGTGPYKLKVRDVQRLTIVDRDGELVWSA